MNYYNFYSDLYFQIDWIGLNYVGAQYLMLERVRIASSLQPIKLLFLADRVDIAHHRSEKINDSN